MSKSCLDSPLMLAIDVYDRLGLASSQSITVRLLLVPSTTYRKFTCFFALVVRHVNGIDDSGLTLSTVVGSGYGSKVI